MRQVREERHEDEGRQGVGEEEGLFERLDEMVRRNLRLGEIVGGGLVRRLGEVEEGGRDEITFLSLDREA